MGSGGSLAPHAQKTFQIPSYSETVDVLITDVDGKRYLKTAL